MSVKQKRGERNSHRVTSLVTRRRGRHRWDREGGLSYDRVDLSSLKGIKQPSTSYLHPLEHIQSIETCNPPPQHLV